MISAQVKPLRQLLSRLFCYIAAEIILMKYIFLLIASVVLSSGFSYGQEQPAGKQLYNPMFKWRITIPEGFENMSPKEYAGMQKKGADAIEKAYDSKVINQSKPIFVFKSDQMHYFESNYQPFNVKTDGSYAASCKNVGDVLYTTFAKQLPGVKMDTTYSAEVVDKLNFRVFKLDIFLPNDNVLTCYMFNRLFGNRDFSVVVMFVDRLKGEGMLNSFRSSTFAKN
jgi:hypothetical protein